MKEQFSHLSRSGRTIVTITIISLTGLISTTSLSQTLLIPSSGTKTGLAFAVDAGASSNTKTRQYIMNARQLLNQTFDAYQKQNYTGALALATKAYLDNFEFVEGPVQQHDKTLKQNTEFMMRGNLRGQIKHKYQSMISKL